MIRIKDNTLAAIRSLFHQELDALYDSDEVNSFFFLLCEHYLGINRAETLLRISNRISESEILLFDKAFRKLKEQQPIQYIIGQTSFAGLTFNVNKHVLIPRPETEELIEWVIKSITQLHPAPRIIDIGTGSGCIPVSIKHRVPTAEVIAIDISKEALQLAKKNALLNKTDITFIEADALNPLSWKHSDTFSTNFDIIISNPPYVLESEKSLMKPNVLDHEPHLALFVQDTDPLLFYRHIADMGKQHLSKNGYLFFEINEAKSKETKRLLEEKGYEDIQIRKDLSGKERMVRAQLRTFAP